MSPQQLPSRIREWLHGRGIKDFVIDRYCIDYREGKVVIPVHGADGKIIFNKYRRDPESNDGPKYQYDKGAKAALYGLLTYDNPTKCVIAEGELDCLRLLSEYISSVSTTGGSGTFEEEWAPVFAGVDTYICYDNDEAGMKGAFHVQSIVPWAKIVWLPDSVGVGGDITDYLKSHTREEFMELLSKAERYEMPWIKWKDFKTKKELTAAKKEYEVRVERLMLEARAKREKWQSDKPLQYLIKQFMNEIENLKRNIKYFTKKREDYSNDTLKTAKSVPIPRFIKFDGQGNARCIWHNERTGSMHYYEKQNRVKCFGCDKMGDVIDVVQTMYNVNLQGAIEIILKENGKTT